jgi:hypothetical protein
MWGLLALLEAASVRYFQSAVERKQLKWKW